MSEQPSEPLYTAEQLRQYVLTVMAEEKKAHDSEIANLKATVDTLSKSMAGSVPTSIRENGAGLGNAVHETWSQFEQNRAYLASEERAATTLELAGEAFSLP